MNCCVPRRQGGKDAGFTMIEMLIVIAILVIIVSLIVGVSGTLFQDVAKKQTITWQGIIMDAVETYQNNKHVYPGEGTTATPEGRSANLYAQLSAVPQSADKLKALGGDALDVTNKWFKDAKGNVMDYRARAGMGGRPVIISPGPDAKLGTGTDADSKDNIRSDGQ